MIPPLARRCPACGYWTWSRRFAAVPDADPRRVTCPACGHQFQVPDDPRVL
ncbi:MULTISPECIES: hypothetical protein [Haloarcula]|uniref:hypothetical protein n=1 Tax=Haloarcula TaxID=2237 RepID=UPI0023ED667E|nr:hypothetical protein [Halomicroarcula sp. XH51]